MAKISVAVICFDEESKIERCLKSVSWADEIVVLDSFSSDETPAICRKYTDKFFQHSFDGHIEQKNRALDHCSNDWVFSIDADEVVSDELRASILDVKDNLENSKYAGYSINRKIFYLGKWIEHTNWSPDYKIRLIDKSKARWGGTNPHDKIILDGEGSRLSGVLYHYSYDSVSDHLRTIDKFTTIMAKEYRKKGKKPSYINITLRPLFGIFKSFIIKRGFLEGKRGWMIALLDGYYVLLKFIKIYELDISEIQERKSRKLDKED